MMTTSGTDMERGPASRPRERAPNLTSSDPYAVLGLVRGASPREIKRAYFDLVRQYPPEEHPDAFKLIRAAYEKLRTAGVKAETDPGSRASAGASSISTSTRKTSGRCCRSTAIWGART